MTRKKSLGISFPITRTSVTQKNCFQITIDTEIKAKRNKIISELITFRFTKTKAKVKFGVKYLCGHKGERSAVPINIDTKAKAKTYFGGINFTLISVSVAFV